MSGDGEQRAYELFHEILALPEPQRPDALRDRCGDDEPLHDKVAALLRIAGERSPQPTTAAELTQPSPARVELAAALEHSGRYHVKQEIASGGMGTVYEAMQLNPRRPVAIKVLKRGIASASALRRFEFEAQILGRLRHPGIAQIHEAGTFESDGYEIPFFSMEYIPNARSITEYAVLKKLGTRQRLTLFSEVCDAVQHGHQKGIIHRDLKPGNILVDSSGRPKIIDFGVARATDSDMAVTSAQTDVGQLIGTLQYMSPEQCEADPHALDTRSDVYALGVVLYELLAEQLPYDLTQARVYDIARIIREQPPARPSTVNRALRGDIETIVLMALEKDRDRRYQSARELAADIRRYLADEPIAARPQSLAYQFSKFAKRNRAVVAAGAVVLLALTGATAVSTIFAIGQARARVAESKQTAVALAVSGFLVETINTAAPNVSGQTVTVAQVLIDGAPEINRRFADAPAVRMALHRTYGSVLRTLDRHDLAEQHYREALDIARVSLAADDPARVDLLTNLGVVLLDLGRDAEAGSYFEQAATVLGSSALPDVGRLAEIEMTMAFQLHDLGDHDLAEYRYRKALTLLRTQGDDSEQTARCMTLLGWLLVDTNDLAEAETLVRHGLAVNRKVVGEQHTNVVFSLLALGYVEQALGNFGRSADAFRRASEVSRELDMNDIMARMLLAGVLEDATDDPPESDWDSGDLGGLKPSAVVSYRNRGRLLHAQGRPILGDERFNRSIRLDSEIEEASGESARALSTAVTRRTRAECLLADDRSAEAESELLLALELQRGALTPADRSAMVPTLLGLAKLLLARGDATAAELLASEAVLLRGDMLPAETWPVAVAEVTLGRCLAALGRHEQAQETLERARSVLESAFGDEHRRVRDARVAAETRETG